jgi:RNA recognition motif-containing protein
MPGGKRERVVKKLFIGNLPYQANEGDVEQFFQAAGVTPDSLTIMRDKFSGTSRGFGFAEISDDATAERAIANCNGKNLMGRNVVVNEARPLEDRPPRSGGKQGGGFRRERNFNRY